MASHPDVAWMLLAPIVLDTLGLDSAKNKVTSLDEQAARDIAQCVPAIEIDSFYKGKFPCTACAVVRTQTPLTHAVCLAALAKAKQDIRGLTQADLLRGDYKEIATPLRAGFRCVGNTLFFKVRRASFPTCQSPMFGCPR